MNDHIEFETLLPDLIPMVPGAPDSLIISQIRAAAIDFCEKSEVYNVDLERLTTIPNIFEYELPLPKHTTCHRIMQVAYQGRDLEPISNLLLDQRKPDWRNKTGTPEYFVKQRSNYIWLAPVPSQLEPISTHVRACLKPVHDAQGIVDWMMNDYRDDIVNGTLFRLLRMPSKAWSDEIRSGANKAAPSNMYGALYQEGINAAKLRSRQADMAVARKTRYAGVTSGTSIRFRGYKSNN